MTENLSGSESDFYEWIGRAVSAFGRIEILLCHHFALLTQMKPFMAKAVFMSARSLRGRTDMLDAAIAAAVSAPDFPSLIPFMKTASKRTGQWSACRNLLAHGSVMGVTWPESKYAGQRILVDSGARDWPNPTPALTREDIETATHNFGVMGSLLAVAYNPPMPLSEPTLKECHALVQLLPTRAHEKIASQSFSKRLERLIPENLQVQV